jgi:hypothetical protein
MLVIGMRLTNGDITEINDLRAEQGRKTTKVVIDSDKFSRCGSMVIWGTTAS